MDDIKGVGMSLEQIHKIIAKITDQVVQIVTGSLHRWIEINSDGIGYEEHLKGNACKKIGRARSSKRNAAIECVKCGTG
jgi:hypothetical protein